MGRGDIIAMACILLLFVLFAVGVVALQCCFNECHRRRRAQQAAAAASSSSRSSARWVADVNHYQTRKAGGDPEAPPMRPLPAAKVVRRAAAAAAGSEDAAVVEECVVCLADLEDGEEARFLPCCNHGFHAQCVDTWLASRSTCPLCRVSFATTNVAPPPPPASALPPPLPAGRVSRIRPAGRSGDRGHFVETGPCPTAPPR
ncbi:hypothetical protein BS78_04G165300 [Paspalum vaginatum]|nr:hypothetical protein BS78_04G165300 [Paspalum vaginatum]